MGVLVRKGKNAQSHSHMKTEAETGVMLPQTMEPWGLLPAGRGKEAFSPRAFGGSTALSSFDFRLLASRTVREYISVVLSHPAVLLCYGSPGN